MKEIIVNKECYINQENIIKSKDWLEAVVSVLAKDTENTNGFLHFCLAANTYQQCCEHFSMGLIRDNNNEIEYVSKIKFYDTNEDIETYNLDSTTAYKLKLELESRDITTSDCLIVVVFGEHDEILALGYAFNYHNGYYSHEVKILENNNMTVTYL